MTEEDMTTIRITKKNVEILEKMKVHPNQSYDEVLEKLLTQFKDGKEKKEG